MIRRKRRKSDSSCAVRQPVIMTCASLTKCVQKFHFNQLHANVSIAVVLCCFRKKYQEGCLHKPLISSRFEKPRILWCAFFQVKTAWLCQNLCWRLFKRLCNFSWYSPGNFDTICLCVTFCLLSTKSKLFYKIPNCEFCFIILVEYLI